MQDPDRARDGDLAHPVRATPRCRRRTQRRERAAEQQRERAGVGAVVEPVGAGAVDRQHRTSRPPDAAAPAKASAKTPAPPPAQHQQQQQRPHQVELLLDRDRPGVQQRRLRPEVIEVALAGNDEAPVGGVAQRRERVAAQRRARRHGGDEGSPGDHRRQQDRHRRQQPAGPAAPEAQQADPAGLAVLAQQQAGDQEAGKHEEDVDPEQAAGQPADAGVVAHDAQHGQRADPVERRNVLEPAATLAHRRARPRTPRTVGARSRRAVRRRLALDRARLPATGARLGGGVGARGDRLPPGPGIRRQRRLNRRPVTSAISTLPQVTVSHSGIRRCCDPVWFARRSAQRALVLSRRVRSPHAGFRRARPATLTRIPALDGMRAIAVIAVLLFHAGLSWIPGGTLGVDVFFVLSGFLITALLVAERDRAGRIGLGAFYLRRARRLLPAARAGAAVRRARLGAAARAAARRPCAATCSPRLFYVANWRFAFSGPGLLRVVQRPVAAAAHLVARGGGAVLPALAAGGHPAAAPRGATSPRWALGAGGARVRQHARSSRWRASGPTGSTTAPTPGRCRCCSARRSAPGSCAATRRPRLQPRDRRTRSRSPGSPPRRARSGCSTRSTASRRSSTAAASC